MVKLVVLFRRPADPQSFLTHYLAEHKPLLRSLPGLLRLELASSFDGLDLAARDRRGPPFLMAELYWESRTGFETAIISPEGQAMLADLRSFAERETTMFLAEVQRDEDA